MVNRNDKNGLGHLFLLLDMCTTSDTTCYRNGYGNISTVRLALILIIMMKISMIILCHAPKQKGTHKKLFPKKTV